MILEDIRSNSKSFFLQLFTDRYAQIIETVKHRLGYSNHANTYIYLYTHKGTSSFGTSTDFLGTSHIDDLIPLFPLRKTAFYSTVPSDHDRDLIRLMSMMWTNFARTGLATLHSYVRQQFV